MKNNYELNEEIYLKMAKKIKTLQTHRKIYRKIYSKYIQKIDSWSYKRLF